MKASDLFVRALVGEGVRHVFAVPGEENLDLLQSLKDSSIRVVVTRHEQPAGFMAATYGRLTGKAGVCLSTLGPGATNLVTAAAYAQLGAMPMLMVTGQKPIKTSKQGFFQIIDTVDMMRPITKYTQQIVSADNVPARVREAFRQAEEERPGAVHLELPEDIARDESTMPLIASSYHRRPIAEQKAVQRAVEMIEASQRPLLLIGAAANRKLTSSTLNEFLEHSGIPFFTTQMGKGVIDERSPLCLGCAALSDDDFLHRAIDAADLIVNVGHDIVEKPPFFMRPGGRQVIHVNFVSAKIDAVYFPQLEVIGDIANSMWQLRRQISRQAHWDFSFFQRIKQQIDAHIQEGADDTRMPLCPQRIVADVRRAMPADGVVALDNGMYKIWFARNYQAYQPNTLLLDNALASMGAGLPSAIAASLVCPNRKVLAVCGDGGFMMNSQEMETAVRLGVNLVVLVLRDDAYGMIKWKQQDMGLDDFGLDFSNPDFVQYAASYGAAGHRVERAADLMPLLAQCLESEGVHLIDVPVDYSDNVRVLKHEIKHRSQLLS
ncbi:MAG: acetolactate synthase large subunit [Pirellulaceae bacterium]